MPQFISRWIIKQSGIDSRLKSVVGWYLTSLMCEAAKHTLERASRVSGLHKAQFSRLLSRHIDLARQSLTGLSQKIARTIAESRRILIPHTNWSILLIVDATLHRRSSLHVHNSQRFNHGEGFVVGHQWTNIVLLINDRVIPLPPIAFLSKNECKRRGVEYVSEHDRLFGYLKELSLGLWVGAYRASEVVVLMDAGYSNKKLLRLIHGRGWAFVCALKSNRNVRSIHAQDAQSRRWQKVKDLFWATRKHAPWETIRDANRGKRKLRKEFRARRLVGYLKGITCKVALVCSEKSKGNGRIYLVCSDFQASTRAIVLAYRRRWWIGASRQRTRESVGESPTGVKDSSPVAWEAA